MSLLPMPTDTDQLIDISSSFSFVPICEFFPCLP
uniref:Uncharacterized protein n=1 Tax=Rhizophora mucronata TaxID=61149 RepID=A0A2P2NAI0_RHIMU